jgi:hypothetical protein
LSHEGAPIWEKLANFGYKNGFERDRSFRGRGGGAGEGSISKGGIKLGMGRRRARLIDFDRGLVVGAWVMYHSITASLRALVDGGPASHDNAPGR